MILIFKELYSILYSINIISSNASPIFSIAIVNRKMASFKESIHKCLYIFIFLFLTNAFYFFAKQWVQIRNIRDCYLPIHKTSVSGEDIRIYETKFDKNPNNTYLIYTTGIYKLIKKDGRMVGNRDPFTSMQDNRFQKCKYKNCRFTPYQVSKLYRCVD